MVSTADIEELSFEEAVAALEAIVTRLEGEGLTLSETESLYEEGRALGEHCQRMLEAVTLRVEQLAAGDEGTTVPLDVTQGADGGQRGNR